MSVWMLMTACMIRKADVHPFTHVLEITSAGHTFHADFEFPDGHLWIEPVPLIANRWVLKMHVGGFEHAARFENELGNFAQCVSESIHFFTKLHRGNFRYLISTMTECMVYFGQVYGRITVDQDKTVWPVISN